MHGIVIQLCLGALQGNLGVKVEPIWGSQCGVICNLRQQYAYHQTS
jgi:hypothetical protein